MKPRNLLTLFVIALLAVLQCTVLNYIQIFGNKPDILLILIIFCSLYRSQGYAISVAMLCGIFSEATSGIPSGLAIFAYSLGALILSHIVSLVNRQKIWGEIWLSFVFSFSIYLFLFFPFQLQNTDLTLFNALRSTIVPASFYTACASPFLFRFLKIVFGIRSIV